MGHAINTIELMPLQTSCEKCRLPIVVTLTQTPLRHERYGATWTCPCCHAEHLLGVIGHIVSVRSASVEPLVTRADSEADE